MTENVEIVLVQIASASSNDEAHLYRGLLEQEGITCKVRELTPHAMTNDPFGQHAALMVEPENEQKAIELLTDLVQSNHNVSIGDAWKGEGDA